MFALELGPLHLARIGQRAEQEFVGVQCGIMDQFANLFGKKGSALKLDCRTLEHEDIPVAHERVRFVLFDTGVKRTLTSSEYNLRRSQCEAGVAFLRQQDPAVRSLRDVPVDFYPVFSFPETVQ